MLVHLTGPAQQARLVQPVTLTLPNEPEPNQRHTVDADTAERLRGAHVVETDLKTGQILHGVRLPKLLHAQRQVDILQVKEGHVGRNRSDDSRETEAADVCRPVAECRVVFLRVGGERREVSAFAVTHWPCLGMAVTSDSSGKVTAVDFQHVHKAWYVHPCVVVCLQEISKRMRNKRSERIETLQ